MNDETIAFGAPVVGLFVGAVILVASLFVTGLSLVTALGGIVVLLSIAALALAVARTASEELSIGVTRRDGREPRRARGAK
ncbi:hypothetical protein [Natronococcus wangiae]|uniref:hypothetical protein n=1 Tax=Natronococcus wangiae TaxID=3068275 RepID=UPI00273FDCF5|nr:hypothetical protein [Natronococcus sp. AD5]